MSMFVRDAGFGIYPVLLFGIVGLFVALRYAGTPSRDRLPLLIGLAVATVLMGVLGAVVGVQTSAQAMSSEVPMRIFLFGVRESLNNVVAALLFATLHTLVGTYGTYRLVRDETANAQS